MKLFNNLIKFSIRRKFVAATVAGLLLLAGLYALKTMDIEAYPDFTNPMVQVITQMPGKSAEDIERLATIPLEKELNGIPNEQKLYSSSLLGLSVIKVVFADGLESPLIRQQVLERIHQADLPDGVVPLLGPDSPAIGEIFRYTVDSGYYNPMTLK
ncbi:MAG: efflux RND transporter permease subunit, partial [Heliobacteriaceae bacterium]|nr:efflux RND transporter permease subunit [Heliobacteriaceae bacterium]